MGQLRESSGSQASQPFRYTGEFWEDGADAYHLRARDYLPELGRFNQRDSWQGDRQRPITLNAYLYGDANPVMNIDPSGNMSMMGLNLNMPMLSGISFAIGRGIVNCSKTLVQFSAGFMTSMTTQSNDAFLLGINGSGRCGALAWMGAFYAADRMGLKMPLTLATQTPHFGSFNKFKKKVNMALFGSKSALVKGKKIYERYIEWHHVVEKEHRAHYGIIRWTPGDVK